ncbi:hypothetical protein [Xanthobacter sediminis]
MSQDERKMLSAAAFQVPSADVRWDSIGIISAAKGHALASNGGGRLKMICRDTSLDRWVAGPCSIREEWFLEGKPKQSSRSSRGSYHADPA